MRLIFNLNNLSIMNLTNLLKKPSAGIAIAFIGIFLSVIIGCMSGSQYVSAKREYKHTLENSDKQMREDMQKSADGLFTDGRSLEDAQAEANAALDKGKNTIEEAKQELENAVKKVETVSYIAMVIGLISCGWGFLQIGKFKKQLGTNAKGVSVFMYCTFALFTIGTLLSLCSPMGVSWRPEFESGSGVHTFQYLVTITLVLFFVAWILWFVASWKLNKLNPANKGVYRSVLYMLVSVVLFAFAIMIDVPFIALIVMLALIASVVYFFWAWFKYDSGQLPAVAPAPVAAETAKAEAPAAPKAAATPAKSNRNLIVIVVAAVVIIGLLCAFIFKSDDNDAAEQPVAGVQPIEALDETPVVEPEPEVAPVEEPAAAEEPTQTSQHLEEGEFELEGSVAGKAICGAVYINAFGDVRGAYCYGTKPTNNMLRLEGTYDSDTNHLTITEYYDDKQTGEWHLTYEGYHFLKGTITNYKGNTYNVDLTFTPVEE